MSSGRVIVRATFLILALSLLSRFLGLGREMAIAYAFGAKAKADAFFVASIIPYTFSGVVGTALATVIVPVFAGYAAQGRQREVWQLLSRLLNAALVLMLVLSLLGVAAAPLLTRALGGGFPPATLTLATKLTVAMMPAIIFLTVAGIFGGILNANNIFGPPALGPAIMNVMVITGVLAGARFLDVYGVALGVVAGSLAYAAVQLPALRHVGFAYTPACDLWHREVRRVGALLLPVMLASGIGQVYTFIDWRLASGLAEGSIAALNYANKLMNLPQGLLVTAVTTAIFPTLSRLAAEQPEAMAATLRRALKWILLLGVPGAVGLITLRAPVVMLLFERGAFDARATGMTAQALLCYAVGLAAFCLNLPLTRGFFAFQDTWTPLLISAATVPIKLLLSLALVRVLHHAGLALATSVTITLNMCLLSYLLYRRLPALFDASFCHFAGRLLLAAALMGVGVYVADGYLAAHLKTAGLGLLCRVAADIAAGALLFFAAALLLRLDELLYLCNLLREKGAGLLRGKVPIPRYRNNR
ncbi:murein biosynthesis integral membrane protein MurJ [Thermodesulfitimonas sp.]